MTNCSDGGVLGMVPGLIGQIQALEIVKIILGMSKEQVLSERMITFDGLSMKFRNIKIRGRQLKCEVCGDNPTITDVSKFDYAEFCHVNKCSIAASIKLPAENSTPLVKFAEIFKDKEAMKDIAVIDVRPPVHFGIVSLPGALNIPLKAMERDNTEAKQLCAEKK